MSTLFGRRPFALLCAALAQPEVAARLRDQGIEQRAMRADEMPAFNAHEIAKWAQLVKRSGAQVD